MSYYTPQRRPDIKYLIECGAPLSISWEGWRSDIRTLQAHGWAMLASQHSNPADGLVNCTISMTSPDQTFFMYGGWTMEIGFANSLERKTFSEIPPIPVVKFSSTDLVRYVETKEVVAMLKMKPVDAEDPYAVDFRENSIHPRDTPIFKYREPEVKEIYIQPNSVDECLTRILQLQHPVQQELKQKGKFITSDKKQLVHTKTLTLESQSN